MLVYGWKLVDYPEKLGPEGQFYSPIIWESVTKHKNEKSYFMQSLDQGNLCIKLKSRVGWLIKHKLPILVIEDNEYNSLGVISIEARESRYMH